MYSKLRISFLVNEIFFDIKKNFHMFISIVLITFVSLLFAGLSYVLQTQIYKMKGYWYDKVNVTVFLCTNVSNNSNCVHGDINNKEKDNIFNALDTLVNKKYIKNWFYESKDDALVHFKKQFSNSPISESIQANQLPDSVRINLDNPNNLEIINNNFEHLQGIDTIIDQKSLLKKIFSVINIISSITIFISLLMSICAIFLIFTMIKLSGISRKREIKIMRLVGASKFYIQLPFIIESIVASILGSIIASISVWIIIKIIIDSWLISQYPATIFISSNEIFFLFPLLTILSILLALFSSLLALRKYLSV